MRHTKLLKRSQGAIMSKDNKILSNNQLAQYLDQELPLLQFDNDLLMADLTELLSFDIEPLSDLGGDDDK